MISVKTGDILRSDAHALVNTVNCVGVMGKGIALAFKKKYPSMYADYVKRCERGEVKLGQPYVFAEDDGHLVVNFPTKDHWRAVSRLSDIVAGLDYLRANYKAWGLRSIAVPPLGCGNGQLEWRVVGPTLHRELAKLDIPVDLYAPKGTPSEEMQLAFFTEPPLPTESYGNPAWVEPGWLAILEVLSRISERRYKWPVGRVRFQKIAYFLSALGVPTKLAYDRGSYGPYSADVKPVTSRLINNGLLQEQRRGSMIEMMVGSTFQDGRAAYRRELASWERPIQSVVDLFARMTTDEAEVAASVHLVAAQLRQSLGHLPTEREVLQEVLRWKARRNPPLDADVIRRAIENLALLRWIDVEVSPELHEDEDDGLLYV